ncbi:MAG: DUF2442 domain-containing protein [Spirochaetaceae bacterium]|jgi:hypothetical protein|nr:DUF2442 domain-containing protein [Spirochaetaceae bacterium]
MFIKNDIAYAGTPETYKPIVNAIEVKPLDNYRLWFHFSDDSFKIYDCASLINEGRVFTPLKDKNVFDKVYLVGGAPTWCNGTIDIAPETIYEEGVLVK